MASESIHGRIFKIVSSETDDVYVGSTTQTLKERFGQHRSYYNNYLNGKSKYVSSSAIMKYVDARIELLHEALFESIADLHRLEGQYMQTTDNCINRYIAGRSSRQYRLDNADVLLQQKKIYRARDPEKWKQYIKEYQDNNKDKIRERNKQPIQCPVCKSNLQHGEKARHERSKKHQSALSQVSSTDLPTDTSTSD